MGYFDRVTVSSHILYTANQETETTEGVSGVLLSFMCLWNVPRMGALITCMDPSVGHLNGILARVRGNLNNNFRKGQMPGDLPGGGGGCWSVALTDTLQYKIGKGRKQISGRFSSPWNSLWTWMKSPDFTNLMYNFLYLPNTVGKRKFIFGDRNLRLRDSAFVGCAPQKMMTEMM